MFFLFKIFPSAEPVDGRLEHNCQSVYAGKIQTEETKRATIKRYAGKKEAPSIDDHLQTGDAVVAVARDIKPRARVHQARVPALEVAVGVLKALVQRRQRVAVLVRRHRLQGRRHSHRHEGECSDGQGSPRAACDFHGGWRCDLRMETSNECSKGLLW